MSTLTITAKGQVTLRKDILEHLGAKRGDRIDAEPLPDKSVRLVVHRPKGRISDAFNTLRRRGRKALSPEEISEIATGAWTGKQ